MRHHLKCVGSALVLGGFLTSQTALAGDAVPLSKGEIRATQLSTSWQNGQNTVTFGDDGKVIFLYGKSQPTIVCAPLRLCDLELQAGEEVLNVHTGDTVRWKFDGARSGPDGSVPHVLIKPTESGIQTSLVITTDRRSYHIHLKSSDTKYMARMGFDYAHDTQNVVYSLAKSAPKPPPVKPVEYVATKPGFKSVDDLDYDYKIKGDAKWKPLRVFNDGSKTYIEMPKKMKQTEAPALIVLGKGKKEELVNYRLKDGRYIIDRLFENAVLVAGVGSKQVKIKISWEGA